MAKTVNYDENGIPDGAPTYLFDQAEKYRENPALAGLEWFREAHFGLSLRFGLYSLIGKHEDVRKLEPWPEQDYVQLPKRFTCARFDAMEIVQLAIAAGARYVLMPARYRDGFCLYNSHLSDFNSVASAANRDLVGEMASVCEYHGIGLCLEYSLGHDWQQYAGGLPQKDEEALLYQRFVAGQLRELLIQYGPVAAIRFEGLESIREWGSDTIDCQSLYDLVHDLQAQCLVSFAQGILGSEDYFAVEQEIPPQEAAENKKGFIYQDLSKPLELRLSLTPGSLGYCAEQAGKHLCQEEVWQTFAQTYQQDANFLLNTALMPDGSLDLEDIQTLLAIGERLEKEGYPGRIS
ncbi:MAG: alpha-L-fucosidase [Lentisphaeria bacterium]